MKRNTMWEFIDNVVYINLARRTDRRIHMENFTKTFGDKVIRFEAIEDRVGLVGCCKSHLAVLNMAKFRKWKNVLILEDDTEWNSFEKGYEVLKKLASSFYDVIMLGGTFVSHEPQSLKLHSCKTTSAYLVSDQYYDTLISNFEEGLGLLTTREWEDGIYALDAYWQKLQYSDTWFIVHPCLVYQIPGYSDICSNGMNVDYTGLFTLQ